MELHKFKLERQALLHGVRSRLAAQIDALAVQSHPANSGSSAGQPIAPAQSALSPVPTSPGSSAAPASPTKVAGKRGRPVGSTNKKKPPAANDSASSSASASTQSLSDAAPAPAPAPEPAPTPTAAERAREAKPKQKREPKAKQGNKLVNHVAALNSGAQKPAAAAPAPTPPAPAAPNKKAKRADSASSSAPNASPAKHKSPAFVNDSESEAEADSSRASQTKPMSYDEKRALSIAINQLPSKSFPTPPSPFVVFF